ncbi:unnamed protein product [Bursaphelenchus xylophilus]|uniref:(pine wood nematode) hypothetical protein n=1 Tax=Bursaphelenchus xylophilus TaxID=6326 RepID=A0A1I7RVN8_BURXY|nr:unnamed protein product [Bursaphelenchus xylophilus]CAG9081941.1 unnamed protein product [Bursaphelenchus xylophilus]
MSAEVEKANGSGEGQENSKDSDSDTEVSTDDVYEIQKIVGHKFEGRKVLFRIRWVGYGPGDDTWEPEGNLLGSTSVEMVDEYKKRYGLDKKTSKPKQRAPKPAKKIQNAILSDSDFDLSQSSKQNQPQTSSRKERTSSPEDDEDVEMNLTDDTGWFGVKPDESHRDLKNLFVTDRKLTQTEKLLTDIHDSGANRMTRSQIRELLNSSTASTVSPVKQPKKRRTERAEHFRRSASPEKSTEANERKRKLDEEDDEVKAKKARKESKEVAELPSEGQKKVKKEKRSKSEDGNDSKKHEKSHKSSKNGRPDEEKRKKSKIEKLERKAEKEHRNGAEPGAPKPTAHDSVKDAAVPIIKTKVVTSEKKNNFFFNYRIPTKGPEKLPSTSNGDFKKPRDPVPQGVAVTYGSQKLYINDGSNVASVLNELPKENDPIEMDQKAFNEAVLSGKLRLARSALLFPNSKIDLNWKDEDGSTLLHKLAESVCDPQHNPDDMIDLLINSGADPNIVDKKRGQTPLHVACSSRRNCHIIKLLRLSVNLDAVDANGETALGMVMKNLPVEITKMFLMAGADYFPVFRPRNGFTKAQMKPVLQYADKLQMVMDKIRDSMIKNASRFHTYCNVYQTGLFGREEIEFKFYNGESPAPNPGENRYTIVMCAIGRNVNGKTSASISVPCPIIELSINGRILERISPMVNFVYGSPALIEDCVHTVKMKLFKQNTPDLLFFQVITIYRTTNSNPESAKANV